MPNINDLLLDSNQNLLVVNGDFVIGNSLDQNQEDIINYFPGELKQFPAVGVGILKYYNGSIDNLDSIIRQQLNGDGLNINQLEITLDASSKLSITSNVSRP